MSVKNKYNGWHQSNRILRSTHSFLYIYICLIEFLRPWDELFNEHVATCRQRVHDAKESTITGILTFQVSILKLLLGKEAR